jgi:carbon storage regulator
MLILTRRIGESLFADGDIKFTILALKGKQVKIGVTAPAYVSIEREELVLKINYEENFIKDQAKEG